MRDLHRQRLLFWKEKYGINPKYIIDIGASSGSWSDMAKSVFPNAKYHLIEGDDRFSQILTQKKYSFDITILDSDEKLKIWTSAVKDGFVGGFLHKENTEFGRNKNNYNESFVLTQTLDTVLKNNNINSDDIGIIKLDVQGSEMDIIKGSFLYNNNNSKTRPLLILEISLVEYNIGCPKINELLVFMQSIGYELRDVIELLYYKGDLVQFDGIFAPCNTYLNI